MDNKPLSIVVGEGNAPNKAVVGEKTEGGYDIHIYDLANSDNAVEYGCSAYDDKRLDREIVVFQFRKKESLAAFIQVLMNSYSDWSDEPFEESE